MRIEGGRFLRAIPCYQSGPYEEEMRDRMRMISEREIQVQSFTSRVKCYGEDPTKSIIMELEGGSDAVPVMIGLMGGLAWNTQAPTGPGRPGVEENESQQYAQLMFNALLGKRLAVDSCRLSSAIPASTMPPQKPYSCSACTGSSTSRTR